MQTQGRLWSGSAMGRDAADAFVAKDGGGGAVLMYVRGDGRFAVSNLAAGWSRVMQLPDGFKIGAVHPLAPSSWLLQDSDGALYRCAQDLAAPSQTEYRLEPLHKFPPFACGLTMPATVHIVVD